jgi:hypothetical protein
MLDLYDEFAALVAALEAANADYAICDGMAMAIHGLPRATVDVDLLVPPTAVELVFAKAYDLGFTFLADPMTFAGGAVEIRRATKIDAASGDTLSLDALIVTAATEPVWNDRIRVRWERGELWVVSRHGLANLKRLRGSGQDRDDIEQLEGAKP